MLLDPSCMMIQEGISFLLHLPSVKFSASLGFWKTREKEGFFNVSLTTL